MSSSYLKYDDSGRCNLAPVHHFVPILDDGGRVGILCIYCDYVLFEHASNTFVTPGGEVIEATDNPPYETSIRLGLCGPRIASPPSRLSSVKNMLFRFWKKIPF